MTNTTSRRILSISALFLVALAFVVTADAQLSQVDPTFNAVPSGKFTSDDTLGKGVLVQPDGKLVIWGGNFAIDGSAKGYIARLYADGTVDPTFTYCRCLEGTVDVAIQPDGKLLVSGGQFSRAKMIRLNPDGSQDLTFVSNFTADTGFLASGASIVTLQSDGKIFASVNGSYCCGFHGRTLTRLLTDGSTDPQFTPINYDSGRLISTALTAFVIDSASGQFYMGTVFYSGGTTQPYLKRYNSNGTVDSTFESPSFLPSLSSSISDLALQSDGGVIMSGRFDSVNGATKRDIVRILPAGNVDLNFTAPNLGLYGGQLEVLQSGKILVGYGYATNASRLARLNANGSLDDTFLMTSSVNSFPGLFKLDAMERILFFGISEQLSYQYFRLNPNGDRDVSFNPNVTLFGKIYSLARQADGKILMAGRFVQVNGFARESLARVNADGTLDPTLDAGSGFSFPPAYLLPQSDGKIIAAGNFSSYKEVPRPGIARILADGTLDVAFSPTLVGAGVDAAALQTDGKILIAGSFTSVNGMARTGVARLNADGTLDNTFNPIFAAGSFVSILQQPDGKIMVSGTFAGVNGFNRSHVVRLIATGELDQSFNATGISSGLRLWLQGNGKYVFTGATIQRRNADGSVDAGFAPPLFDTTGSNGRIINSVVNQPDGSLILGGRFDLVGGAPRRNLVRLSSTGGLDPLFFPNGADGEVRSTLLQPDGKVVIGGDFSRVETTTRSAIARLSIAPFRRATPFDFDGDGRADISVFRPSTNRWYEALSSSGNVYEETFGIAGDVLAPGDFDGDGVTDEAIYRPSSGQWWYHSSSNGNLVLNQYGSPGDVPRPSDFDGDGRADIVLYRPSNNTWYRIGSTAPTQQSVFSFGAPGDQPITGDFDGDGKGDIAVFRPSTGDWWYAASSANNAFRQTHWGQNGDIPVPADYDGDGRTDNAVYRPSDGGWYIYNSGNGSITTTAFGVSTDRPVAADYDGDGRADIAVFRPSTGIWYLLRSTAGFAGYQFGISTDTAIAGALIP